MVNLLELTECENGVVIFRETMKGFVANWSSINGIPRLSAGAIVGQGDGDDLVEIDQEDVDPDIYDLALQLAGPDEVPARFWENEEVTVVTFFLWD